MWQQGRVSVTQDRPFGDLNITWHTGRQTKVHFVRHRNWCPQQHLFLHKKKKGKVRAQVRAWAVTGLRSNGMVARWMCCEVIGDGPHANLQTFKFTLNRETAVQDQAY